MQCKSSAVAPTYLYQKKTATFGDCFFWEIAKPEHGRLLLSVVLAVLGVVSGIVPFVSAAKIISGMISGNREWSYYLVFVAAAFAGFALKSLFYVMGLSVSHRATFSLLGEIRNSCSTLAYMRNDSTRL